MKGFFEKPMVYIILNRERVNVFSLSLEQGKTINFHHLYSTFYFAITVFYNAVSP